MTLDIDTVPVAFNMDLANGPTSKRYCYAASELLGVDMDEGCKKKWSETLTTC